MRRAVAALALAGLGWWGGPAAAQNPAAPAPSPAEGTPGGQAGLPAPGRVELRAGTGEERRGIELSAPPAVREGTRPRDAGFYPEDTRVRHEPAFVEPFTHAPSTGPVKKMGASLWTAPAGGRGSLGASPSDVSGWLGFGFTLVWE